MTTQPEPGSPEWAARIKAQHDTDVALQRAEGRVAQLEGVLRTLRAGFNSLEADAAGDSPFADGIRYAVGYLRPRVPPLRPGGDR